MLCSLNPEKRVCSWTWKDVQDNEKGSMKQVCSIPGCEEEHPLVHILTLLQRSEETDCFREGNVDGRTVSILVCPLSYFKICICLLRQHLTLSPSLVNAQSSCLHTWKNLLPFSITTRCPWANMAAVLLRLGPHVSRFWPSWGIFLK